MPPIIGLTTYGYQEKHTVTDYYDHYYALPKDYADSVTRAGGIPLLIPSNNTDWKNLWSLLDGIIVTGGTDVAPRHYNGNAQNVKIRADAPERDDAEIALIRHAVAAKDKPVLCICRGMQVLNVALGGTLHAHIPDILEQDIHRSKEDSWSRHDCHVESGSQLANFMRVENVNTFSGHHQAADQVADDLKVTATAPDGIIEALSSRSHPWLIGVQWHPEKSAAIDPTQQRIFDELVKAAGKAKNS